MQRPPAVTPAAAAAAPSSTPELDQPTVAASPSSVWISWRNYEGDGAVEIVGAPVAADGKVGAFAARRRIPNTETGNYADLAIGPKGQLLVTYEDPEDGEGDAQIMVAVDPDGLGPKPIGTPTVASGTDAGGFDYIPAQDNRSVDAEPGVVYDRSGGPLTGRAYLVYTDEAPDESYNTKILLRYSDDDGRTWSAPVRVNDDATANSQFLPRMQIDQATGKLAIAWHDARRDLGVPGKGSTNAVANDDAEVWAAVVTPTRAGFEVGPNVRVSTGTSSAAAAQNRIDYGDYIGIDFVGGVSHPVWGDNSNATGDNPDGTLRAMDVYTARVAAAQWAAGDFAFTVTGGLLTVTGTEGADRFRLDVRGDTLTIANGAANDTLRAGGGNDSVYGGGGADQLDGDDGDDALDG